MPYRAWDRQPSGPRSPFTFGSLFARGIRQSWNESSEVIEARIENLPWMSSVEKPGVPRSTRKPPISSSSSLAQTTATSAMEPLVIQSLVPFRTYAPSWRRARVFIAPGSEPWSGSVSPKQPTRAPVARRGSHCSFCASEPYATMGNMTRPDWIDAAEFLHRLVLPRRGRAGHPQQRPERRRQRRGVKEVDRHVQPEEARRDVRVHRAGRPDHLRLEGAEPRGVVRHEPEHARRRREGRRAARASRGEREPEEEDDRDHLEPAHRAERRDAAAADGGPEGRILDPLRRRPRREEPVDESREDQRVTEHEAGDDPREGGRGDPAGPVEAGGEGGHARAASG